LNRDEQLDALYAELPTIECQGHCWDSCGPIDMAAGERARIREAGVDIPAGRFTVTGPKTCEALTWAHQCSVYDIRPLICRLWGLNREMVCNFGCKPSRLLSDRETYELIARAHEISGDHEEAEKLRAMLAWPDFDERMKSARQVVRTRTDLMLRMHGKIITR
jgi:Fe-S-cluster containining protein